MRVELEDKARTGLDYQYNTDSDLVEVSLIAENGAIAVIAELSLEVADRWRTGKAKVHSASGWCEPITAETLTRPESATDEDDHWLQQLGISSEA
jgi:hypothetical protein